MLESIILLTMRKTPESLDVEGFRARLVEVRQMAGLSRGALSLLCGASRNMIRLHESGLVADVTGNMLVALNHTLGVNAHWLLTGEGKAPSIRAVRAAVARAQQKFTPVASAEA